MKDSFELQWKHSALKELKKLPKRARTRILSAVGNLAEEPLPKGTRKLIGSENIFRLRTGVYGLWTDQLVIEILRARHRKDAYR